MFKIFVLALFFSSFYHRIKVIKKIYLSKLTKSKRFCGVKITRNTKCETQTDKMEFILCWRVVIYLSILQFLLLLVLYI